MSKTKTDEEQQSSGLGIILLFAFGVAVLVGLYAFSRTLTTDPKEAPELPLCAIMVEVDQFDAAARANVAALEAELQKTGVVQKPFGPADMKVLLPGAKPGDTPTAKAWDGLADDEWARAWTYMTLTEYHIPRVLRLDGTAALILVDAKGGRDFAPDAGAKILQACEPFRAKFKTFRVYSRALGIGTTQDRDALNASFGCQTSWIIVKEPNIAGSAAGLTWRTAGGVGKLAKVKGVLRTNKHFRRVTTDANWVTYYWTTKLQAEKETPLPTKDEDVAEAFDFAKANGIVTLMSPDGKRALVDTATDCEGQENARLVYDMAANLQVELKVEAMHPYQPTIVTPFKGEQK